MNRWSVDFHARTPLTEQLYVQLRREIEEGVLEPGTRLPSRRRLAEMAGVSVTTAEGALGRLLEEGYALSRPKSGLYVNAVQPRPRIETAARTEIRWNFGTGVMDASQFPYSVWAKRMREVLSEQKEELLSSGDSRGSLGLRQEIAGVLRRLRGIQADPERIVVGAGTEDLVRQVLSLVGRSGLYAVEDPGYPTIRRALVSGGARIAPLPLRDGAIDIGELYRSGAGAVYVTPGHQFPTGTEMDAESRTALLVWAREGNGLILEDDYDSEFHYEEEHCPPLVAMNPERVLYLNTFARTLAPGLRIAFMLLPKGLSDRYTSLFGSCSVSCFEQETLAKMIRDGSYERHINRMRLVYKRRLTALEKAIKETQLGTLMPCSAGLYVLLRAGGNVASAQLCERAAQYGVRVKRLAEYGVMRTGADMERMVLLGFAGMDEEKIQSGIEQLRQAWIEA